MKVRIKSLFLATILAVSMSGCAVSENNDIDSVKTVQKRVVVFAMLLVKIQNIAIKGKFLTVKMLHTIAAHVGSCFAQIGKDSFCDTGKTGDSGEVEIENRIAVLEPMGKGAVEVSVNDPIWLF